MKTVVLEVEGMMCPKCAMRVKKALEALPGVSARVDLEAKQATVQADADPAALVRAVCDAGYPARLAQ